jgi:Ca-activated chloride channel family protein
MIFLKPEYFTMMLIPALILFYFIMMQKSALESHFDKKVLEKLRFDNNALGKVGRNMMLFMALLLMIIALARPVKEKQDIEIQSKAIDMMVALDVSKSMMAGDFYPSRLAFAKKRFMEFVDSFKEANIGVIAFSSEGFLVSPMTQDSATLKYLVNNLSLDSMTLRGTDLLIPIEKGKAFLKKSKEKIIIIFTDGGDNQSFQEEIAKAKEYEESIYIYAVATPEGAVIKEGKEVLKDHQGNIVISKLNEGIKKLAFESGGAFIVGNYEDNSIALLVDDIKKKFKMHTLKEKKIKEYRELFYYPLSFAILFLLFAFHSLPRRSNTIMIIPIMIGVFQLPLEAKLFDFLEISKAKEAYEKGAFEEAEKEYKKVVKSNKTPESIYNLANAQYKAKKYKEALKSYQNIMAKTAALQYKKAFNSGNAYFQLQEYEKAIDAYEKAQKIDANEDVAHNLALAKKRLKQRESKKKEEKKESKKEENKNKDNEKGEQKKGDAKKQQKQKKESPKREDKKREPEQKQEKQEKRSQKEPEISKKEEKMWQKHLEQMRPKTLPMKFNIEPAKRRVDEKPW